MKDAPLAVKTFTLTKGGVDRFIEVRLGKEQLDSWTLGPAPGPLPRIGPCQRRRGTGPADAHKGNKHPFSLP